MDNKILPKISVIMPVYNGSKWVNSSIQSVLDQSFTSFELIIVDDQSTDDSLYKIQAFSDHRIRVIPLLRNVGLPSALNLAITQARGSYIARLDQDDLMRCDRLKIQSNYLDIHLDCALVGSWANIITEDGKTKGSHRHPTSNGAIQFQLLFDNPFVHSSVLMRRSAIIEVGLYCTDKTKQPPEDYELWVRLSKKYTLCNLPQILTSYREVKGSLSREKSKIIRDNVINISTDNLFDLMHKKYSILDCQNLARIMHKKSVGVGAGYFHLSRMLTFGGSLIYKSNSENPLRLLSVFIKIWLKLTVFFLLKK